MDQTRGPQLAGPNQTTQVESTGMAKSVAFSKPAPHGRTVESPVAFASGPRPASYEPQARCRPLPETLKGLKHISSPPASSDPQCRKGNFVCKVSFAWSRCLLQTSKFNLSTSKCPKASPFAGRQAANELLNQAFPSVFLSPTQKNKIKKHLRCSSEPLDQN